MRAGALCQETPGQGFPLEVPTCQAAPTLRCLPRRTRTRQRDIWSHSSLQLVFLSVQNRCCVRYVSFYYESNHRATFRHTVLICLTSYIGPPRFLSKSCFVNFFPLVFFLFILFRDVPVLSGSYEFCSSNIFCFPIFLLVDQTWKDSAGGYDSNV